MHTEQKVTALYERTSAPVDYLEAVVGGESSGYARHPYEAGSSLLALDASVSAANYQSRHWMEQAPAAPPLSVARAFKRVFDVVGAAAILAFISPLLATCAATVFLSSPGPVFFRHRRLGLGGNPFHVWKFRTMCMHAERVLEQHFDEHPEAMAEWTATQKLTNDPRVFSAGRLMRRLSLDELPQLWNVLKGEMSLIGPRPIVQAEAQRYGDAIEAYYAVRPGMTGLWQVSGRSNTTYAERVQLDERYVMEWSLRLDASIFLKTFKVLVKADGAY